MEGDGKVIPGFALPDGMLSVAVERHGAWKKAAAMLEHLSRDVELACSHTVRDEAFLFLKMVKMQFRFGIGWKPLSRITLEMRKNASLAEGLGTSFGGRKPLARTGFLRRSANLVKTGPGAYFVGVHRSAGDRAVNIADVQENGRVIPITDKMRAFFRKLFVLGVLSKPWPPADKKYIIIKKRSFLEEVFKAWWHGAEDRVEKRFEHYFNLASLGMIRTLKGDGPTESGE